MGIRSRIRAALAQTSTQESSGRGSRYEVPELESEHKSARQAARRVSAEIAEPYRERIGFVARDQGRITKDWKSRPRTCDDIDDRIQISTDV